MRFRIGNVNIWRERPGVVSPGHAWCASYGGIPGWLHICDSLPSLVWEVVTQFRSDRHLVGY